MPKQISYFLISLLLIGLAYYPTEIYPIESIHTAKAALNNQIGLNIQLEKSPSFSIKANNWLYDNQDELIAEAVITNFSNDDLKIEADHCLNFEIKDKSGKTIILNGNDDNTFCKESKDGKKMFLIEHLREYYFYLHISIGVLNPGQYTLKVTLGNTPITTEKSFYVIDTAAACLGIPELTGLTCPFTDQKTSKDYVELSLQVKNGIVSNQDVGIKDLNLTLKNKAPQVIRMLFNQDCFTASLLKESATAISQNFSPTICHTSYLSLGNDFLKSNRLKIIELQPFEIKPIFSAENIDPSKSIIELPLNKIEKGEFNFQVGLKDQEVKTESTPIKIIECQQGYTVDKDGKCRYDPQLFYKDKIGLDLDFEKIPDLLGEDITAYLTISNRTANELLIPFSRPNCFSFTLYEQKELVLKEVAKLNEEPNTYCKEDLNEKSKRQLAIKGNEKITLTLKMNKDHFSGFSANTTPQRYQFVLEAKLEDQIAAKLKQFNLRNYVNEAAICGGSLNIICQGENLICNISDQKNLTSRCEVKKPEEDYFLDIKNHFAREYIEALRMKGILEGYPKRLFKPDQPITRAEFVKIMVIALNLPVNIVDQFTFNDVDISAWYGPYIESAKTSDIIEGYRDKNGILLRVFKPDNHILRQEAIKIVVKSFKLKEFTATNPPFTDVNQDAWYYAYLFTAFNSKSQLIEGFQDNTFKPQGLLTRGQAAKIIKLGLDNLAK